MMVRMLSPLAQSACWLALCAAPLLAAEPIGAHRPLKSARLSTGNIDMVALPPAPAEAPGIAIRQVQYQVIQQQGPGGSYYVQQGSGGGAIYGTPGGYEARVGSPYHYFDPSGGQFSVTGDPYYDHWGPGFHRNSLHGHYRFPYYNYRAPWYYPGRAVYNRDTNFAW